MFGLILQTESDGALSTSRHSLAARTGVGLACLALCA